jgi:hypothetical protein
MKPPQFVGEPSGPLYRYGPARLAGLPGKFYVLRFEVPVKVTEPSVTLLHKLSQPSSASAILQQLSG